MKYQMPNTGIVSIDQLNLPNIAYMTLTHLAAIAGVFCIPACKYQTLGWAVWLYVWSGLGITVGSHRLWAHRRYKAHWTLRAFLMLMGSIANQYTIYRWVRDHRTHHKFSETDADPHNVRY